MSVLGQNIPKWTCCTHALTKQHENNTKTTPDTPHRHFLEKKTTVFCLTGNCPQQRMLAMLLQVLSNMCICARRSLFCNSTTNKRSLLCDSMTNKQRWSSKFEEKEKSVHLCLNYHCPSHRTLAESKSILSNQHVHLQRAFLAVQLKDDCRCKSQKKVEI